jgi:DNA-binding beta-propeller fold protein YncE
MSDTITRRNFLERSGAAFSALVLPRSFARGISRLGVADQRFLYVAEPGIRNYVEWGGIGILVYDMHDHFRFVRRIPTMQLAAGDSAENVKGICASAVTGRVYVSTIKRLLCIDLNTDALLWNRAYEGGCDRMSITPDGRTIYLPTLEGPHWFVIDASTGDELARIVRDSGAHNTICSTDGARAYLAGLRSRSLTVVDTRTRDVVKEVGPFSNVIRPFTIDGAQRRCYVNVNDLLGFEIGDIPSGRMLDRVEVPGFKAGPVKRHGCPSHGIGLRPDERELWLCDGANSHVHVFDMSRKMPRLVRSIPVRDQPGWVTFSIDGQFAIPSTGEVIDTRSKRTVATLSDENGHAVQSEKLLEVDFSRGRAIRSGDQFGMGKRH